MAPDFLDMAQTANLRRLQRRYAFLTSVRSRHDLASKACNKTSNRHHQGVPSWDLLDAIDRY